MTNFKDILKKIRSDKKLMLVSALGILGAALLFFGSMFTPGEKASAENIDTAEKKNITASDIEEMLEKKLTDLISDVKGAGKANVMVTVSSSGEYVYAENRKVESDSDSLSDDSEIVIYESSDKGNDGLVISVKSPEILGVAVLCEGGESSVVKSEIVKLVTSLFGIGSDRVYVGAKLT